MADLQNIAQTARLIISGEVTYQDDEQIYLRFS